jgi:uncharacterized protein (DUF362 family)
MVKENLVVIKEGDKKFEILDNAVTEAGLYECIEESFIKSGKKREEFLVVVKPNFMVITSAADLSNYTDTELVVHILERFYDLGFRNLFVVESENVLSQWYDNRSVSFVAKYSGYKEEFYKVENLTRNTVPHHFKGILKHHLVGKIWKEADFRISFAKNKTHPAGVYTLTLKNIFGVMVLQNKYLDYHKHLEWDHCVVDMLDAFPIDFGIVDAIISADGPFGFRGSKNPKLTNTIIAGQDCIAVDWVGAKKMGINPMQSRLMKKVVKKWGEPFYKISGPEERYKKWHKPPFFLPPFDDILEEWYTAHSIFTHCMMLPPDPEFPEPHAWFYKLVRFILGFHYQKKHLSEIDQMKA